jgi:hypothetical protein
LLIPHIQLLEALDPEFNLNWLGDRDSLKASITDKNDQSLLVTYYTVLTFTVNWFRLIRYFITITGNTANPRCVTNCSNCSSDSPKFSLIGLSGTALVVKEAKKMLTTTLTTASDLVSSGNVILSPHPVDTELQPEQIAVSLASKSKKMKLFDFMAPGALPAESNIVRNKDQPDPIVVISSVC